MQVKTGSNKDANPGISLMPQSEMNHLGREDEAISQQKSIFIFHCLESGSP